MSVWLTPSLEPFYGGTYFPPTSRWGRPGFVEILEEIARVWREERGRGPPVGRVHRRALRSLRRPAPGTARSRRPACSTPPCASSRRRSIARRGGFGDAPKFPRPSELLFLLREHARTGDDDAARHGRLRRCARWRSAACATTSAAGFHRYSVDGDWRVPHFEKMLYDQAQLVLAYVEAAQLTGEPFYAEVAADTLDYVRRDLTNPGGGFYSAEDADSVPPEQAHEPSAAQEGGRVLYLARRGDWRRARRRCRRLSAAASAFCPTATPRSIRSRSSPHKNLLYTARSIDEIASMTGRTPDDGGRRLGPRARRAPGSARDAGRGRSSTTRC